MILLRLNRRREAAQICKKTTKPDAPFTYQPCLEARFAVSCCGQWSGLRMKLSQHVCTPGSWRDIHRHTQWLVCARWELQAKPCLHGRSHFFFFFFFKKKKKRFYLKSTENASGWLHFRRREPEQQKTASHLKHAASFSPELRLSKKLQQQKNPLKQNTFGFTSMQSFTRSPSRCLHSPLSLCYNLYSKFKTKCSL